MKHIQSWSEFFSALGIVCSEVSSNKNALCLDNIPGAPIFVCVSKAEDLQKLHTKARTKSDEMGRLMVLGLPLNHPGTIARLPGDIILPSVKVYAGHVGSTFSLSGHRIENSFLVALKKEVTKVIENGSKVKTPLCDWLLKLADSSWPYGKPSSKQQLDSLLALVAKNPAVIGHIRSRQLSYGRGCGDGLLLASDDVVLQTNQLNQRIHANDFRFISLENEVANTQSSRHRIQAVVSNAYLSVMAKAYPTTAVEIGAGACIGASVIGQLPVAEDKPVAKQQVSTSPSTEKIKVVA